MPKVGHFYGQGVQWCEITATKYYAKLY